MERSAQRSSHKEWRGAVSTPHSPPTTRSTTTIPEHGSGPNGRRDESRRYIGIAMNCRPGKPGRYFMGCGTVVGREACLVSSLAYTAVRQRRPGRTGDYTLARSYITSRRDRRSNDCRTRFLDETRV